MTTHDPLPSWRESDARASILGFLAHVDEIPPEHRIAVYDNDGTLWCEKPHYTQLDFFVWELRSAVPDRPELAAMPEYQAVLDADMKAIAEIGLERVAVALVALFEGREPAFFEDRVRQFFDETLHPDTGTRYDALLYRPMLEVMAALEHRGFVNCLVTGGGGDFVRAVSQRLYGVPPERVVGTRVGYEVVRTDGRPVLLRTARLHGEVNEGPTKITNIQMLLGRRPSVAAGNSPGDADMLEYADAYDGPSLALLVNHDDAEREYAYESVAGSFDAAESVRDTAARLGWTQISMRDDWATVFGD